MPGHAKGGQGELAVFFAPKMSLCIIPSSPISDLSLREARGKGQTGETIFANSQELSVNGSGV